MLIIPELLKEAQGAHGLRFSKNIHIPNFFTVFYWYIYINLTISSQNAQVYFWVFTRFFALFVKNIPRRGVLPQRGTVFAYSAL